MKVIREDKVFQPVTIVLESQDEVDLLHAMSLKVSGKGKYRAIKNDRNSKSINHSIWTLRNQDYSWNISRCAIRGEKDPVYILPED